MRTRHNNDRRVSAAPWDTVMRIVISVENRLDYQLITAGYSLTVDRWDAFVRERLVDAIGHMHSTGSASVVTHEAVSHHG